MALVPIANQGNFLHIYDFRVKPGQAEEFIRLFNEADYSDDNPMHKSPHQVKDGVLVQDVTDPDHLWLIGEWTSIEEHKRILAQLAALKRSAFVGLIEGGGGKFVPAYAKVVSSTPQDVLDRAAASRPA
jgi:hypothetical protein